MNIHYNRIKSRIEEALNPTHLKLIDDSADHSDHYNKPDDEVISHLTIEISSEKFNGLKRLPCHQMVNDILKDEFNCGLHALKIKIIQEDS